MATDERTERLRRAVWLPALTIVSLLALVFGLLRAQGASGPPRPVLSTIDLPADPTTVRSASFMFTNAKSVTFECSLDAAAYTPCGTGVFGMESYPGPLALGPRRFSVRARSGSYVSAPTVFGWTIVPPAEQEPSEPAAPEPAPAQPSDSGGDGTTGGHASSDGTSAAGTQDVHFEISGDVSGLVPGIAKTIPLTLHNPSLVPITVTSITVSIDASRDPAGCPSRRNIELQQAVGISAASPIRIPPLHSVVVYRARRAPRITFVDGSWNQDACKNKTFRLLYSGEGHS